jgi:hypothetical protein
MLEVAVCWSIDALLLSPCDRGDYGHHSSRQSWSVRHATRTCGSQKRYLEETGRKLSSPPTVMALGEALGWNCGFVV